MQTIRLISEQTVTQEEYIMICNLFFDNKTLARVPGHTHRCHTLKAEWLGTQAFLIS